MLHDRELVKLRSIRSEQLSHREVRVVMHDQMAVRGRESRVSKRLPGLLRHVKGVETVHTCSAA